MTMALFIYSIKQFSRGGLGTISWKSRRSIYCSMFRVSLSGITTSILHNFISWLNLDDLCRSTLSGRPTALWGWVTVQAEKLLLAHLAHGYTISSVGTETVMVRQQFQALPVQRNLSIVSEESRKGIKVGVKMFFCSRYWMSCWHPHCCWWWVSGVYHQSGPCCPCGRAGWWGYLRDLIHPKATADLEMRLSVTFIKFWLARS